MCKLSPESQELAGFGMLISGMPDFVRRSSKASAFVVGIVRTSWKPPPCAERFEWASSVCSHPDSFSSESLMASFALILTPLLSASLLTFCTGSMN